MTTLIFRCALAAVICLAGFMGLPFWYGLLVYLIPPLGRLPGQRLLMDTMAHAWMQISITGGGLWGWRLARIISHPHPWRLVVACESGIGIGQALVTGPIQLILHPMFGGAPFHVWFAIQFLLGIGIVVILTGTALGIALRSWHIALNLALVGGPAAVASAGGVLVLLDVLGVRVGAGHANMAKVMVFGFLAATLAGGALFGWVLGRHTRLGSN